MVRDVAEKEPRVTGSAADVLEALFALACGDRRRVLLLMAHLRVQRVDLPIEHAEFVDHRARGVIATKPNLESEIRRRDRLYRFLFSEFELQLRDGAVVAAPETVLFISWNRRRSDLNNLLRFHDAKRCIVAL